MTLKSLTLDEFQIYSASVKQRSFEQTVGMATLLKKRGYQVDILGTKDKHDNIQVAAILFSQQKFGGLHSEIHYGPIYSDISYLRIFLEELKDYAKHNGILELEIKPYDIYQYYTDKGEPTSDENLILIEIFQQCGFSFTGLTKGFKTSDWHYVKDLKNLTEETLVSSYSKKGKSLIQKAHTFGIKIKTLGIDELEIFKSITNETSNRRSYSDKPLEYYQYLHESFKEDAVFLLATLNFKDYLAQVHQDQQQISDNITNLKNNYNDNQNSAKFKRILKDLIKQHDTFEVRRKEAISLIDIYGDSDIPLAASLFIYTNQEMTYLYSGSLSQFNRFYAPALLQEFAMKKAIHLGIKHYNLLGIEGNFDGSDGVLRFKQNFNGYIERRPGSFFYYPKPLKLKSITLIKKLLNRH